MKLNKLCLLPCLAILVGCGLPKEVKAELALIENSRSSTEVIENFKISKDGKTYREIYEDKKYDDRNGRLYVYYQEKGLSSLEETAPSYEISEEVYYDGNYSYSLGTDQVYAKEKNNKEFSYFELTYNFELVSEWVFTKDGFRSKLEGVVTQDKAVEFLGGGNETTSAVKVNTVSNGTNLQTLELTYQQNGFDVYRKFAYSYIDIGIDSNTAIKKYFIFLFFVFSLLKNNSYIYI